MPRWETLVLNKVYQTEYFLKHLQSDDPPQLMHLLEIFNNFSNKQYNESNSEKQLFDLLEKSLDASIDSKLIYQVLVQMSTKLNGKQTFSSKEYCYLDVIAFSTLSRCRIWPKIFKQFRGKNAMDKQYLTITNMEEQKQIDRKSKKGQELDSLLDWYTYFLNTFKMELEWKFDRSVLSERHVKMIEKRQLNKKTHREFFDALKRADMDAIQTIIDRDGIDSLLECMDSDNQKRATHFACASGSIKLVKYLDQFENVTWNELDLERQTPIFDAVTANALEVVRYLGDVKHVDLDHKEQQQRTPFYSACFLGQVEMIQYLYSKGVDINSKSVLNRTPLTKACYLNHVPVVDWLLKFHNINFMQQDIKGRTALHNAAWGPAGGKDGKKRGDVMLPDSPESILLLLEMGHPVDYDDFDGNTALQSATSSKGVNSVHILIQNGADREHQNKFGETPLFQAARYGHTEIVSDLALIYNCSITTPDNKGMTPMVAAVVFGFPDTYKLLINWLLNFNSIINYKSRVAKQTDVRYQAEQNLKVTSQSRPIIDINYILLTCKAYDKYEYAKQFMTHLITQIEGQQVSIDLFYVSEINQDLHDHIIQTYMNIDNTGLVLNLIKFAFNVIKQDSLMEFKLKLVYSFLDNGKLSLLHHIILDSDLKLSFSAILLAQQLEPYKIFLAIQNHLDSTKLEEQISDLQLISLIQQLNQNTISISNGGNLLHLLVKHRRIKTITELLTQSNKIENNNDQIWNLLNDRDDTGLTPSESAYVMKSSDICYLFEQYMPQDQNKIINSNNYQIPRYKVWQTQIDQKQQESFNNQSGSFYQNYKIIQNLNMDGKYASIQNYLQSKTKFGIKFMNIQANFKLIDKLEQIPECMEQLNECNLIAVDVEFYSESINLTFICTIQISTIHDTYIIDALRLYDWLCQVDCPLKQIFVDQNKIKLFHGCDNDLRWLASNYGLLINGLYDTAKAESIIQNIKSSLGLQQLTQKYYNLNLDKSFQRADWRIRPIPEVMVKYAREDSESLLLIFFKQIEILTNSQLQELGESCSELSVKSYRKYVTQHIHLQVEDF